MFKEKHLSKLIFAVPILFIILTATVITLIHINQADKKFKSDSLKLKESFLNEEKQRLNTIVESINSYIHFKKATSLNILKNRVKSRVEFADKMFTKLYNNSIGIESRSSIQISLLSSLSSIQSKEKGRYFIFGYSDEEDKFLDSKNRLSISNDIFQNQDFMVQYNELIKNRNEGFIFYKEQITLNAVTKYYPKLTYVKRFEGMNLIIGYSEYIDYFEETTKEEVLSRLNLMRIKKNISIFTLNHEFNVIQHSHKKYLIGKHFSTIDKNESIRSALFTFAKMSKLELYKRKYKYIWKEMDNNSRKLFIFNYVPQWDWVVGVDVEITNIDEHINEIIGVKEAKKNESIEDSIKTAALFILIASLLSYLISNLINKSIKNYKTRIESQKNALKNINATLESKVEEKTQQLENLNIRLKNKFVTEVRKNRKKDRMLYAQSKMAAMGEMIGNIAHQWRQPLSTISTLASGNSIKLEYGLLEEENLKDDFNKIVETTKHLSNTIEDFRNFFMENKSVETFDLVEVVKKDLSLIGASMRNSHITLVQNFNSVQITGIKNELLQAILNILNNARDVLIDKVQDNRVIVIDIYEDEHGGNIIIKDGGGGIPEDILEKIFEPYFTTKDKSHGTGIGLYMTKEIIETNMNGTLKVTNEEFVYEENIFKGACFKITLPKLVK